MNALHRTVMAAWRVALAIGLVAIGADLAHAVGAQASEPAASAAAAEPTAPEALYRQHCAACHGALRTGAMGPALLPESLERLRRADAQKVIEAGRPATQMPGFAAALKPDEIAALATWIYTPVHPAPTWAEADIRASRIVVADAAKLPNKPAWDPDPMNLFVVVEGGDHHVSLVDGDRFERIHRFPSRYALHGGPKFSPDGRFVYFGSRDGWVTKYDLWNLTVVAEVRAGLNMRNVAVSGDGRWVMAANYFPHTLALFDAELNLLRTYAAASLDGKRSSRVSAVYDAVPRSSFVVALKDIAELWEISYDPNAEPIFDGLVHDYKLGEGMAKPGHLGVRRTMLDEPLDDFFFDPSYRWVLGATRPKAASPEGPKAASPEGPKAAAPEGPKADGSASAQVVNLDIRRKVTALPIAGMPHLGSGITFDHQGRRVLASPNLKDGTITVIDMKDWKLVRTIAVPGPGFFMRSHERTPYAWTDSMMSPSAKDTLTIIDKRTLEPVASVREPGRTLAHIEFTKDGRYALASVWETDGALVVYDAATFKEVKRLPMRKPVGKYNVWNKISRDEGTSH